MSLLQDMTLSLANTVFEGHRFDCLPISGEQEVLQVQVSGLEEMPIYVTVTDTQILCISYLFKKSELKEGSINELNALLLELSLPMPLSSFGMVGDHYVIYGALALTATAEHVMKELTTLAGNAVDALQTLEPYLK